MTRRFSHAPSAPQLGQAIEDNLSDLFVAMTRALGGELSQSEGASMHHCFPLNPMFKGVVVRDLPVDAVDATIERAIAWFKARNAPFFFFWVGPSAGPRDLGARLQAHGLLSMEEQQQQYAAGAYHDLEGAPGMALDLNYIDEGALQTVPADFTIREAASEADLLAFKQVFVESYGTPEWAGQAWVDATLHAGLAKAPWRIYVGFLGQQPVATNILYLGGGVASVYGIATLPAQRKRGIGAAITLRPLLDARDRGMRQAVLFATEMGVRVYERIGFQRVPAGIARYLWRAD